MGSISKWDHKDEWHREGAGFLVEVRRHSIINSHFDPDEGPHRWTVYAYIYPQHRLFDGFSGSDSWQLAAVDLPLHGGPSLLRWHYTNTHKPASVQVGADYGHLGDKRFSQYASASEAYEVFADADRLFDHLAKHAR